MSSPEVSQVNPAFFFNINKPSTPHHSPPHRQTPEPLPKMFAFPLGVNFNPQQQIFALAHIVENFTQLFEPLLSHVLEEAPANRNLPELPTPVLKNLEDLRNVLVNLHAQLGAGFQPNGAPPLPRELLRVLLRVPVFIKQINTILKSVPQESLPLKKETPTKEITQPPLTPKPEQPASKQPAAEKPVADQPIAKQPTTPQSIAKQPNTEQPAPQRQETLPKVPIPFKAFEEFTRNFPTFVRELTVALPKIPTTTPPLVKETLQVYLKAPVVQVFAPSTPIIPTKVPEVSVPIKSKKTIAAKTPESPIILPEKTPPPILEATKQPKQTPVAPEKPLEIKTPITPKQPEQPVLSKILIPAIPTPPELKKEPTEKAPILPSLPTEKPASPQAFIAPPNVPKQPEQILTTKETPKLKPTPQASIPSAPLQEVPEKPKRIPATASKEPLLQPSLEKPKQVPIEKAQIPLLTTPLEKPQKEPVEKLIVPAPPPAFIKPEKTPSPQVSIPPIPFQEILKKPLPIQVEKVTISPPKEPLKEKETAPPLIPKVSIHSIAIPKASLPETLEKPLQEQVIKVEAPPIKELPKEKESPPPLMPKVPSPQVPTPPAALQEIPEQPLEISPEKSPTPSQTPSPKITPQAPQIVILAHPEAPSSPQNSPLQALNIPKGFPAVIPLVTGPNVITRVEEAKATPQFSTEIPFAFIVPYTATNPIAASSAKTPLAKAKNVKEDEDEDGTGDESLQILTYISGGETWYGDPFGEGPPDEQPLRKFTIKPFGMGIYPVTNEQFADFLTEQAKKQRIYLNDKGNIFSNEGVLLCRIKTGSLASDIEPDPHKRFLGFKATQGKESYPVICVTYFGAEAFCIASGFRLPSEIEWERAASVKVDASGKLEKKFRFGFSQDVINPTLATYQDKSASLRTLESKATPVGLYNGKASYTKDGRSFQSTNAVSPFGCYDMSGNVWEWTSSGTEQTKIIKGGCFESPVKDLRASARKAKEANTFDGFTGFRVALT